MTADLMTQTRAWFPDVGTFSTQRLANHLGVDREAVVDIVRALVERKEIRHVYGGFTAVGPGVLDLLRSDPPGP